MAEIVTLTMNPALDVTTATAEIRAGDKLRCTTPRNEAGGGGINVARVVTALGGEAIALFPAGGPAGTTLCELLRGAGVAFTSVPIAGATRESFTVDETSTGEQYRFVLPGPALTLSEQTAVLDALGRIPVPPGFVVASGTLPLGVGSDFYARVGQLCRRMGARLILDSSGEGLAGAAGACAWLVKPNLLELESVVGHALATDGQQVAAARGLIASGVAGIVVLSKGAEGVLVVTAEQVEQVAAVEVPVRSATGAGDSTVAGITLGLPRGMSVGMAVRFGIRAGAAAVTTPAGQLRVRLTMDARRSRRRARRRLRAAGRGSRAVTLLRGRLMVNVRRKVARRPGARYGTARPSLCPHCHRLGQ